MCKDLLTQFFFKTEKFAAEAQKNRWICGSPGRSYGLNC